VRAHPAGPPLPCPPLPPLPRRRSLHAGRLPAHQQPHTLHLRPQALGQVRDGGRAQGGRRLLLAAGAGGAWRRDPPPLRRQRRDAPTPLQTQTHAGPPRTQVGGTPALLKYLLAKGYIHGNCMTVTGKTMAENLAQVPDLKAGQVGGAVPLPGRSALVAEARCAPLKWRSRILFEGWMLYWCSGLGALVQARSASWGCYGPRPGRNARGPPSSASALPSSRACSPRYSAPLIAAPPPPPPTAPGRYPAHRDAHEGDGAHPDPVRQPLARGLCRQDHRWAARQHHRRCLHRLGPYRKPATPAGRSRSKPAPLPPPPAAPRRPLAGKEGLKFAGKALCFDCEEDMLAALAKDVDRFRGSVVVIRWAPGAGRWGRGSRGAGTGGAERQRGARP
jgi:hypothetical protein